MKKSRKTRILLSIMILLAMFTMLGQNIVLATENRNDHAELRLSRTRWVNAGTTHTEAKAYALNTGTNHPVFQVLSTSGTNKATNYICLNAEKGASWYNNSIGTAANYNVSYDLVADKDMINTKLTSAYKTATGSNYTQIMWILDQIPAGTNFNVDTILAKAGIKYGQTGGIDNGQPISAYYYDFDNLTVPSVFAVEDTALNNNLYGNTYGNAMGYSYINTSGSQVQVKLSKELIEVVEQAAIWYFTNGGTTYDCLTKTGDTVPKAWLRYAQNPAASPIVWTILANDTVTGRDGTIATGKMLQEQASILYNYLIDGANAAKTAGYTSQAAGSLSITPATPTVVKDGDNYKVGPMKINATNTTFNGGITVTTGTNTDITSQATVTGISKTNPVANTDFYVTVPKSSVNGTVSISVAGTTTSIEKKLRIGNIEDTDANAEQAIAEVNSTPKTLSAKATGTIVEEFDLALRKEITGIAGKTLVNESGNAATRTITIDKSTIPNTAKYKHRKDPVVVEEGDTITYKLHIYNEGSLRGYASKIVDQLPTGLTSALASGSTVTSSKGNTYKLSFDQTTNKITLQIDTTKTITPLAAYNGNTLDEDVITLSANVTQQPEADGTTKHYLTNIAYISEGYDSQNNIAVTADRNGNESKTTESPNKTAAQLNSSDADNYKGNTTNQSVKNDTTNSYYYEGEQDDDDFEKVVVLPKKFDLALRKFITSIKDKDGSTVTATPEREPEIGTWKYDSNQTLQKSHPKNKLRVSKGDTVTYTIRVYNEGDIAGYASKVTDYLPAGLSLKTDSTINTANGWTADGQKITTTKLSTQLINAYNKTTKVLDYKDLEVVCVVNNNATSNNLKNIAAITEEKDEGGNIVTDRDSQPEEINTNTYNPTNPEDGRGEQDDDDFEDLKLKTIDLALRKFITKISKDGDFTDTKSTKTYNREPSIDSSKLKNGTEDTAIYNHSKEPIEVNVGDYILYTIRVYNEGDIDGYAGQITDYLPEYLDFVDSTDEYIKGINDNWKQDTTDSKKLTTTAEAPNAKTKLLAYKASNDDGKGSAIKYVDVQVVCKVNKTVPVNKKLTNIAEISVYKDEEGTVVNPDRDSSSNNISDLTEAIVDQNQRPDYNGGRDTDTTDNYIPGQEDDDDFEKVIIKENLFDLALRKFITEVDSVQSQKDESKTPTTGFGREPQVSYKDGKITYTHPKDVLKVGVGDIVTYTIRVYNEGKIAGYAEKIADDIPEYLEYLPNHKINKEYKWVMYDKDGKETTDVKKAVRIITDYTSRNNGAEENLLEAFKPDAEISNTNPDYLDVKVAFKVKDPKSNKTIIINKAEIAEDADENGNPIDDIDSIPDKWNEGEDDQDYENVSVEYFDLSLLKYVTKAIVTENGKTTVTKTGNNGSSKDITPKVEIKRKKINTTTVKFEYEIKITNEGEIAGYATEITDYVPKGLKFYKQDNKGWTDEGNNVISTKLLEDTLLKPGESATVKVVLRWINGANNLSLKTNTAEISQDFNDKGVPDRDSTPDNKKKGEDDIDDAPVLLTISTGLEDHPIEYAVGGLAILTVLGTGIALIKKYVL